MIRNVVIRTRGDEAEVAAANHPVDVPSGSADEVIGAMLGDYRVASASTIGDTTTWSLIWRDRHEQGQVVLFCGKDGPRIAGLPRHVARRFEALGEDQALQRLLDGNRVARVMAEAGGGLAFVLEPC